MDNRGAQIQARGILGEIPIEGNEDFTRALVFPAGGSSIGPLERPRSGQLSSLGLRTQATTEPGAAPPWDDSPDVRTTH